MGMRVDGHESETSYQTNDISLLVPASDIPLRDWKTEDIILNISKGISFTSGDLFFPYLAKYLGLSLQADYVTVGEITSENDRIKTLGVYSEGEIIDNFEYSLNGTPCENLRNKKLCFYPRDLRLNFPDNKLFEDLRLESFVGAPLIGSRGDVLGVICAMFRVPLERDTIIEPVLRIFAERAASEMERYHRDTALRDSEERFRATFEQAAIGMAQIAPDGSFLRVNNKWCELTGYHENEILIRNFSDLTTNEDKERDLEIFSDLGADKRTNATVEKRLLRKDGAMLWVKFTASVVKTATGEVRYYIGLIENISAIKSAEMERSRLEQQLMRSHKLEAIGRLAGNVAHDFNNMLVPIVGYGELILSQTPGNDPRHDMVIAICKAAEKAREVTRRLLVFSRKQAVDKVVVDINEMLKGFERMIRMTFREEVEFCLKCASTRLWVLADSAQMEQLLVNLAVNAQEAMPRGGKIDISVDGPVPCSDLGLEAGNFVCINFRDTGIGIDADTLEHLFEPFFTTKQGEKRTGLGLATVYGIVKQHSGHISVDTEVGKGTTFRIFLPIVEVDESVGKEPSDEEVFATEGTETILLVEDDRMVCDLVNTMLTTQGYNVIVTHNGAEAMKIAEDCQGGIDLLLTDVIMPEMDGKQLYEELAKIRPGISVIYMSGYSDGIISARGVTDQGGIFIQKPFTLKSITRKIRRLLDSKGKTQ